MPAGPSGRRWSYGERRLADEPLEGRRRELTPLPSRRSPTTGSCRTATPAPWSPPTARSTGCACRRSTRPSVFGNLLDRGAGSFRFGPYGINVPTARTYVPGTNVLTTTWHTPGGWLLVHDALVMGPRQGPDTVTPHTRPPADDDAEPPAGAHRRVPRGHGRGRAGLRAGVRLRAGRGHVDRWPTPTATPPTPPTAAARRSGSAPTCRSASRAARPAPATCCPRASTAFCALSWAEDLAAPGRRRGGRPPSIDATVAVLAQLAGPRPDPRPRAAAPARAVGPDHQGPHLHADRRDRGGADHLAAGDARRRAQLGLPLHVDARHDVHAAGAALPEPRLGGRRVHAVRRRPRAEPGRRPADHVRHRRPARPHRVDPRRAVRLRGRATGAARQRRLRPAPERRVRRRPRLAAAAHPAQQAPAATAVAARAVAGRGRHRRLARARPGHLGGARRSRSTTCRPS